MGVPKVPAETALWIESVVRDFVGRGPENLIWSGGSERAWADPLVGFSRGDDPIYQEYKRHVGPFHWTPLEICNLTFPELSVTAEELTVITWILPQTEATKTDQRKETTYPSERWTRTRVFGEEFNNELRRHVASRLIEEGFAAVAPVLSPLMEMKQSERFGRASSWSERHAAYAAGLGTFGLSEGLITPKGKAMRCGSVVARIQVPATPRPYEDHHAYCLFFAQDGACGKCISRCPVGAIKEEGHDKVACEKYIREVVADYVSSHFGFKGYACGLCQCDVPCESEIPL